MSFFPLELQYLIISFAAADWLQQPLLRNVCKSWRTYIDTSPTILSHRYFAAMLQNPVGGETYHLHNIFNYRRAFRKLPAHERASENPCPFIPCILHPRKNKDSPFNYSNELDLSCFLKDSLFLPRASTGNGYTDLPAKIQARFWNSLQTNSFDGAIRPLDGMTVEWYLDFTEKSMRTLAEMRHWYLLTFEMDSDFFTLDCKVERRWSTSEQLYVGVEVDVKPVGEFSGY